jgi:hypothetical protein
MLSDEMHHAAPAIAWANRTVRKHQSTAIYLLGIGFTPREVSLGAQQSNDWSTE